MTPVEPFDDASTARAVIDERGNVARWGAGAQGLLGYEAAEVVGRPVAALLADADTFAAPAGSRWSGTLALRHRDGRTLSLPVLALRRPPQGDPGSWQAVVQPDSARLDPPSDALASAALAQSPCPMLVCDAQLRLRWIS